MDKIIKSDYDAHYSFVLREHRGWLSVINYYDNDEISDLMLHLKEIPQLIEALQQFLKHSE